MRKLLISIVAFMMVLGIVSPGFKVFASSLPVAKCSITIESDKHFKT